MYEWCCHLDQCCQTFWSVGHHRHPKLHPKGHHNWKMSKRTKNVKFSLQERKFSIILVSSAPWRYRGLTKDIKIANNIQFSNMAVISLFIAFNHHKSDPSFQRMKSIWRLNGVILSNPWLEHIYAEYDQSTKWRTTMHFDSAKIDVLKFKQDTDLTLHKLISTIKNGWAGQFFSTY